MSCPASPCTNTSGKNTATVVSVDATTAMATMDEPFAAASMGLSPASRRWKMLSSTTIESSTSMPTPSASPPSDMRLSESPMRYMTMNVAMTEIGMASAMVIVEPTWRRNAKMTSTDRMPPMSAEEVTSSTALWMKRD